VPFNGSAGKLSTYADQVVVVAHRGHIQMSKARLALPTLQIQQKREEKKKRDNPTPTRNLMVNIFLFHTRKQHLIKRTKQGGREKTTWSSFETEAPRTGPHVGYALLSIVNSPRSSGTTSKITK
jgi:hypothetical protein